MQDVEDRDTFLLVWTPGAAREGVLSTMRSAGLHDIHVANAAVSAFSDLAVTRPRMILVEANMRPTSGMVFTRELRATPVENRDVPIILCVQRPSEQMEAAARQAGADGVIFGPPTEAAIRFWLTSTETDARAVVEDTGYVGPDRRLLVRADPEADDRRKPDPTALAAAMARVATANEDAIVQCLGEAMERIQEWAGTGADELIHAAQADLAKAAVLADQRGDIALRRGIEAAKARIQADLASWDADHIGMQSAIMMLQDLAARHAVEGRAKGR